MYYCIFPSKDNTITNAKVDNVGRSGSNSGKSEILELYVLSESVSSRGKSRILIQFDLNGLSSSISAGEIPTSSVEYTLKLKNSNHYETIPYSYDVSVHMLTKSWDEGRGYSMYDEGLKDAGVSNWVMATSVVSWGSQGADFTSSIISGTQHFEDGDEDLSIDVSNIVYAWLTGGVINNGFLIKYTDPYETGSSDLYVKKFYSRHAHKPERVPKLEAKWAEQKQDDRENINYNNTGSLYYYRTIRGVYTSAPGTVYVNIINSSSTVVQTITASLVSTGIYHASGVFVTFTSSTSIYRDVWFNSTQQLFTGTFMPTFATGSQYNPYSEIDLSLINIRPEYDRDQKVTINVLCREKDYKPIVRVSGTVNPSCILLKDAYFRIENEETEEVIVDYSTGSVSYSKLSYDENGNYFKLWTNSFSPGYRYKIKILANYNGEKIIFDKNWCFKIKK